MTSTSTISIRTATVADDAVLRELSALDSARPIQRPALIASVDGTPVAATSQRDGRIVADPFTPTADVVGLLRARTVALGVGHRPQRHRVRLPRLRPAL